MKYSTCFLLLVSLLTVFFSGFQVRAASQWPFPVEAYPQDVVYAHFVLQRMAADSRFNQEDELLPMEQGGQVGMSTKSLIEQSDIEHQSFEDHNHYDYWTPR